jgi:hypothetical protein
MIFKERHNASTADAEDPLRTSSCDSRRICYAGHKAEFAPVARNPEQHELERYLAVEDIDHTRCACTVKISL